MCKIIILLLISFLCFSQEREIAITIDDLPLVAGKMDTAGNKKRATERFNHIIKALQDNNVPTTGFVIAGAISKGQWDFLQSFKKAGLELGNHTYSHYNLNIVGSEKYIADIKKANKILSPILSTPKYFRYPYLAEGTKQSAQKVRDYLRKNNYIIAPVTIDSKDFRLNEQIYKTPYRNRENYIMQLKKRYLSYIWQETLKSEKRSNGKPTKQILLIHANYLNSKLLADIIQMYKKNGYKFITLTDALQNPAPIISYINNKPIYRWYNDYA